MYYIKIILTIIICSAGLHCSSPVPPPQPEPAGEKKTAAPAAPAQKKNRLTIRVNAPYANIRRGPGIDYELTEQVKKGTALYVINKKKIPNQSGKIEVWYLVEIPGTKNRQGWLTGFLTEPIDK